jgi:hypothetical protein
VLEGFLGAFQLVPFFAHALFGTLQGVAFSLDELMDALELPDIFARKRPFAPPVLPGIDVGEFLFSIADQGRIDAQMLGYFTDRVIKLVAFI